MALQCRAVEGYLPDHPGRSNGCSRRPGWHRSFAAGGGMRAAATCWPTIPRARVRASSLSRTLPPAFPLPRPACPPHPTHARSCTLCPPGPLPLPRPTARRPRCASPARATRSPTAARARRRCLRASSLRATWSLRSRRCCQRRARRATGRWPRRSARWRSRWGARPRTRLRWRVCELPELPARPPFAPARPLTIPSCTPPLLLPVAHTRGAQGARRAAGQDAQRAVLRGAQGQAVRGAG
jgi:hypothetical protein